MTQDLHRDVGRHDAQIEGLEQRVESIENKVDQMLAILNQAQGGWKTLVVVATIAGSIGAVLGKFIPFFR